jgi:hypothetical protein
MQYNAAGVGCIESRRMVAHAVAAAVPQLWILDGCYNPFYQY